MAQAPPAHSVWPPPQEVEQVLLLQICVPEQVVVQLPQWLLSEATQEPLHKRRPAAHAQAPD